MANFYKTKKVRDGSPTRAAGRCQNHGGCPYCLSNRLHKHKKHEPISQEH